MSRISTKLPALLLVIIFIFVMFIPIHASNDYHSIGKHLKGSLNAKDMSSGSDPSVHLYVNGNGYVVFSANYSVDGIISFSFDNDRSQNFTTNDVPTGTVFHLVSSPNAGYTFQKWVGSVNSTSNSIYITVNQNINEEAIYQKEQVFSVTFTESALPPDSSWFVNLSNGMKSGTITGSSYSITLTNGSYTYTIATNNKIYHANGGSFQVNGIISNNDISVSFSKVLFTVTFTESNLPAETSWTLVFNGNSYTLTNTSYTFHVTNGSYSYHATSTDYENLSGSVSVQGSAKQIDLSFKLQTYTVTFTESGLPPDSSWTLTFNNMEYTLTNTSYSFHEINGTYFYHATSTDYENLSGSVSVKGSAKQIDLSFKLQTYTVTFTESNLQAGSTWYVNLSNGMKSGTITGSSYSITLTNGSYTYTIATNNKIFHADGGSFQVNGVPLSESVTFNKVLYAITFKESNLPAGSTWYVNLSNGMKSGAITGSSYSFSLTNGSYSYNIATNNKIFHADGGSFQVNGIISNNDISVSFSKVLYTVTFTESGLSKGSTWYVNLSNGMDSRAITGSSYSFQITNGSYTYTIGSISGYKTSNSTDAMLVNGKNVTENIIFSKVTSNTDLYIIIGATSASVIAVVGAVIIWKRK